MDKEKAKMIVTIIKYVATFLLGLLGSEGARALMQ